MFVGDIGVVVSQTSFVILCFFYVYIYIYHFVLVSELEIKAQKDNFEKQSYAIKSAAEVKLAEVQALLETERDLHKTEVRSNLCVLFNVACFGNVNSLGIPKRSSR